MHTNQFDIPAYTAGAVAEALDIPLPTLRTWSQRGYLPFIESESGKWRKYSMLDATYAAALNGLIASGLAPNDASVVIQQIRAEHSVGWRDSLERSLKAKTPLKLWVFVRRYSDTQRISSFFYGGDRPESVAEIVELFSGEEEAGCFVGSNEPPKRYRQYCTLYQVGSDVASAFAGLTREAECE